MDAHVDGRPLSDVDLRTLAELLARYAANHLDQWELWRIQTSYGPVYVNLSVQLPGGATESAYATIWPWPECLQSGH
jgi:hypothetical protein